VPVNTALSAQRALDDEDEAQTLEHVALQAKKDDAPSDRACTPLVSVQYHRYAMSSHGQNWLLRTDALDLILLADDARTQRPDPRFDGSTTDLHLAMS